jgi:hypothetical protein
MRFMMSEGFHEMLVKLWKWYVVEAWIKKQKYNKFYNMKHERDYV